MFRRTLTDIPSYDKDNKFICLLKSNEMVLTLRDLVNVTQLAHGKAIRKFCLIPYNLSRNQHNTKVTDQIMIDSSHYQN